MFERLRPEQSPRPAKWQVKANASLEWRTPSGSLGGFLFDSPRAVAEAGRCPLCNLTVLDQPSNKTGGSEDEEQTRTETSGGTGLIIGGPRGERQTPKRLWGTLGVWSPTHFARNAKWMGHRGWQGGSEP